MSDHNQSHPGRMEKLADNATLRTLSRLAMLALVPLLAALGGMALYLYNSDISTIQEDIGTGISERLANHRAINALQREVAVMQSIQTSDRLADQRWQDRMDSKVDALSQTMSNVENNVASQSAALQAVVREVERARN